MEPIDGDSIRLTVPATAAAVRIARVGAAGVATRAGFSYREVEEVRLAVGEAAALLALGDPAAQPDGRTVAVTYTVDADGLSIKLQADAQVTTTPVSDLVAALLDASVDGWETSDAGHRIVLHKYRSDADDDD